MSIIIERFNKIKSNISNLKPTQEVKIVAVSKTFPLSHVKPLIDYGHIHFGENKVQEAKSKWLELKKVTKILNFTWLESFKQIKLKML